MEPSDWVGVVLTGGASRRMGRDKAMIEIEGRTMAERVAAALREAGAADVARIGGPAGDVPDDHPGEGPLAGVLTALRWASDRRVVVAPCDLVAPSPAAFAALAAGAPAVPASGGPLPVALAPGCLGVLTAAFDAGERSLQAALARIALHPVDVDAAAVDDADTPARLPPGAR